MILRARWAEEAATRIADKVVQALQRAELEDTARLVDNAQTVADTPRLRQLVQFVATAAVLLKEAEQIKKP